MYYTYTVENKSKEKNSSMICLGFQMAHLADSRLEAVSVSQGGDGFWKAVPLTNCEKVKMSTGSSQFE